jgi:hypothetical protein
MTIAQCLNVGNPVADEHKSRKEGRPSVPQIAFVVFDVVSLEQRQKLLLKAHLSVVLRLTLDVLNGLVQS